VRTGRGHTRARALGLALAATALGCSTDAPPVPAPRPPPAPASRAARATASAEAELGLDLRALPVGTPRSGIDLFVLAQGDAIRRLAPTDARVSIRHVPGAGVLWARFEATTAAVAAGLCARVVADYLGRAPRLPITMQPAASLVRPCGAVAAP
jgi:hypothetical protein